MAQGTLEDTYVAALTHDRADVDPDATLVGVVRKPTPWFYGAVDENVPELGPPPALLEEARETAEELKLQGLCEEGAHNAAWDRINYASRYQIHLEESADAQAALEALEARLDDGESIALVCYENTQKKRCHRTILREVLEERLGSSPTE